MDQLVHMPSILVIPPLLLANLGPFTREIATTKQGINKSYPLATALVCYCRGVKLKDSTLIISWSVVEGGQSVLVPNINVIS